MKRNLNRTTEEKLKALCVTFEEEDIKALFERRLSFLSSLHTSKLRSTDECVPIISRWSATSYLRNQNTYLSSEDSVQII